MPHPFAIDPERQPLMPPPHPRSTSKNILAINTFTLLDNPRTLTLTLLSLLAPIILYILVLPSSDSSPSNLPGPWVYRPQRAQDWVMASHGQGLDDQLGKLELGLGDVEKLGETDEDEEDKQQDLDGRDYSKYKWHDDVVWPKGGRGRGGAKEGERLIVVGDVHGMIDSLELLLQKLKYRQNHDTLILVGDLVAKHPSISSSLRTLRRVRQLGAIGVRGNHDQMVLDWRGWMDAMRSEEGRNATQGREDEVDWDGEGLGWLAGSEEELEMDGDGDGERGRGKEVEVDGVRTRVRVPDGWKWSGQHRDIARRLPPSDYAYLLSFPLTLHLPTLHTYLVHAGLLPWSVSLSPLPSPPGLPFSPSSPSPSPLPPLPDFSHSTLPSTSPYHFSPPPYIRSSLISHPESSLLLVTQNRDPWSLINMRGVKKNLRPSKKGNKGRAWFEFWEEEMDGCRAGYGAGGRKGKEKEKKAGKAKASRGDPPENCGPVSVVYGHWAARGLEVRKWTVGLDSGCVYGRKLSAMVIDAAQVGLDGEQERAEGEGEVWVGELGLENRRVRLADGSRGKVVSLQCEEPV